MFGAAAPIALEAYGLFIFRDCIAAAGVPTAPIGFDAMGAAVADLDDIAGEPVVTDQEVRPAAQDEHRLAGLIG